jgi:hypothetical protein
MESYRMHDKINLNFAFQEILSSTLACINFLATNATIILKLFDFFLFIQMYFYLRSINNFFNFFSFVSNIASNEDKATTISIFNTKYINYKLLLFLAICQ